MEKETSISKGIIQAFNKKAEEVENEYSLNLQLVEISGSRWSYVAGYIDKTTINLPPAKLKLTDKIGILIYNGTRDPLVTAKIKRELLEIIK
jgi:hypothetical protein